VRVSPTFFLLRKFRTTNLFSDHCSLRTPLHFSFSAFQFFSFQLLPHPPLNDIAITQMRTLLAARSVKLLK